jgi:mono/diheme cytochrome c family protein
MLTRLGGSESDRAAKGSKMTGVAFLVGVLVGCMPTFACAQESEASIERGRYLVTITGCNDCHTEGYTEAKGEIPEHEWLKGSAVGFRGPWGTSYAMNLRTYVTAMNEEEWLAYVENNLQNAMPPMPWFNIKKMEEADLRSIHKFIASLGAAGGPAPYRVFPGNEPEGPYISFPGAR